MGMSMHDRYYEPEDSMDASEWGECQESIAEDLIKPGGSCYWKDSEMFAEAMGECGYDEEWWIEDVPPEALVKIKEYCWECAMHRANSIMEDGGY
jgi:hypothetical protein